MTKEQRERLRQHFTERASFFALFANDDRDPAVRASRVAMADDYIAALSLLTDEAELQRSVGEAVIASGVDLAWLERQSNDLRNQRGSLTLSSMPYANAFDRELKLYGAIASALREGGR